MAEAGDCAFVKIREHHTQDDLRRKGEFRGFHRRRRLKACMIVLV